ncbi:hypothetical protein LDL77_05215 [Flagellimonas marinaquae]|nr:hypothetical protein LDL77_05215 [Allomuricauda aquimarina]
MGTWIIVIFIVAFVIAYLIGVTKLKIAHHESRLSSKRIKAEVVNYKLENNTPLGDDGSKYYPCVKIQVDDKDYIIQKLEYGKGHPVSFKKGELIDVFWYGGKLYYWHEFERGIFKYLPSKLNF